MYGCIRFARTEMKGDGERGRGVREENEENVLERSTHKRRGGTERGTVSRNRDETSRSEEHDGSIFQRVGKTRPREIDRNTNPRRVIDARISDKRLRFARCSFVRFSDNPKSKRSARDDDEAKDSASRFQETRGNAKLIYADVRSEYKYDASHSRFRGKSADSTFPGKTRSRASFGAINVQISVRGKST